MFQIGDIVWSIIYYFDRPKKTTIKNIIITDAIPKEYIVTYDNRDYIIRNENIYPTQMDADIYWSIQIQQDFEITQLIPTLYSTDDFERANKLALSVLSNYVENFPDKLIKYL